MYTKFRVGTILLTSSLLQNSEKCKLHNYVECVLLYVGGSRSSKNHVRVSQPHRLKSCITGIQTATGISGGSEGREVSRVAIEVVSIDGCERRQG